MVVKNYRWTGFCIDHGLVDNPSIIPLNAMTPMIIGATASIPITSTF